MKKKIKTKNLSIVYVKWIDASHADGEGWKLIKDYKPQYDPVESVGFLVHEDERSITLAVSVYEEHYGSEMLIPKGMIIHREDVVR